VADVHGPIVLSILIDTDGGRNEQRSVGVTVDNVRSVVTDSVDSPLSRDGAVGSLVAVDRDDTREKGVHSSHVGNVVLFESNQTCEVKRSQG
jgi:hypothetical protein